MMISPELKREVREFFGYIMVILGERGFSRADKKCLIRGSGLIEKCKTLSGIKYVLHHDVEGWCDYIMNGYRWPDYSKPNQFDKYYEPQRIQA